MSRSINRSMLRKKYEDFCKAWNNEKTFQRIMKIDGKELPEGQVELGRKPTFSMWLAAHKAKAFTPQVAPVDKAVEVKDTSWEE